MIQGNSWYNAAMFNLRLLFVAVAWGVNFSFVKFALADFYPLSFTVIRFFFAALFLFGVMIVQGEPFRVDRRDAGKIILLGFIGISLYNILFIYGLQRTTASNSALFIAMSPLFAALTQFVTKNERMTSRGASGLLLSFVGATLIIWTRTGGLSFSWQDLSGDLLTLAASFSWALYTLMAKPLLEKYSPLKMTAYTMAIGTLLLLPLGMPELVDQPWRTISFKSWSALGFGAFIAGGIAYTLWYQGVKQLGVTRTIVYHYLMPFVAVIFAALFLHEQITFLQIFGGCSILAGVYLVQTGTDR
jgi:drug/metabolite transporter (DMT)-like permease